MNKYENKYCIIREKGNKSLVRFLYEKIQPTDIILHSAVYISPDYKRGEIEDLAISKFSLLNKDTPAIISIFAGRIADAGVDPIGIMKEAIKLAEDYPNVEILWASCRELYSIIEANDIGCHIITVPNNILKKIDLFGKDLNEYSIETVNDFFNDGKSLGFSILE